MAATIGERVQERVGQLFPGRPHREIAADVGMTPDAFSRALNNKRAFSSIELASIADLLDADIHWLITGAPDPHRLVVAARHDFDHETGDRDVPGREGDEAVLGDIALAYRQAFQTHLREPDALPNTVETVREALGDGFVRPFADRLEDHLDVDVVRVADLSTAYSFTIAGRRVIAVPATGNWFRENWSIAHELGHLVHAHHDGELSKREWEQREASANRFAAELLLQAEWLRSVDWEGIEPSELAQFVWDSGVSTDALARRLSGIGARTGFVVETWATQPTQRLLRRYWKQDGDGITRRMDEAAVRRFPLKLQKQHLKMIESGDLGKGTLAWMLAIDPDALEVDAPDGEDVDSDVLADAMGL